MNLIKTLQNNIDILKGNTPEQKYKKDMNERLINYSTDKSYSAYQKVIKYLDNKKPMTKEVIEETMQIIKDEFLNIPLSIRMSFEKHTEAVWNYKRKPLKPIKKGISKADPYDETVIINIDKDVIAKLTNADIVWIMNHAANTAIAQNIATVMAELQLQKLTMYEVSQELQKVFSEFTPVKFKELFGEERYWKIVTQSETARISSYAYIDDLELAGYEYYHWVTRPSEKDFGCICPSLDGTIYKVSDARDRITAYYEASEIEDPEKATEAMKEADPWLKKNDEVPNGLMPQVHGGCYCEIVGYLGQEFDKPQEKEEEPKEKEPTKEEVDNYLRDNVDKSIRNDIKRLFKTNPELMKQIIRNNPNLKIIIDKRTWNKAAYNKSTNEIIFRNKKNINLLSLAHETGHALDKISPLGKTVTKEYINLQKAFDKDRVALLNNIKNNPAEFQKVINTNPNINLGTLDVINSMTYDSGFNINTYVGHEDKYWNVIKEIDSKVYHINKNAELFSNYYELRKNGNILQINTWNRYFPEISKELEKWYDKL